MKFFKNRDYSFVGTPRFSRTAVRADKNWRGLYLMMQLTASKSQMIKAFEAGKPRKCGCSAFFFHPGYPAPESS